MIRENRAKPKNWFLLKFVTNISTKIDSFIILSLFCASSINWGKKNFTFLGSTLWTIAGLTPKEKLVKKCTKYILDSPPPPVWLQIKVLQLSQAVERGLRDLLQPVVVQWEPEQLLEGFDGVGGEAGSPVPEGDLEGLQAVALEV